MAGNDGYEFHERLGDAADGRRVLAYLTETYRHSSESEWRARIESGRVSLDRQPVCVDAVLRCGQRLSWERPAWQEPDAPCCFAVLYRDDDLLAVAKPAGLPVLPGAGFMRSTLLALVRGHDANASPLHRLGRGTSGVVLFARTREARVEISRQWAERAVHKRYRALAGGRPSRDEFRVDLPIGPVPNDRLGSLHAASPQGRPATSRVVVLERRDDAFLCDVTIDTGRPHQIRIHLAAAGHPLVGDPLYPVGGVPAAESTALPGDLGYLLHAAELGFRHPRSARPITVHCAPPRALRRRR